jgi:SPP1 family predicted phage head-tail adaptor
MDKLAVIQTPSDSVNALGEPVLTYSTFATRWVELVPMSGTEQMNSMATQGTVMHRIRMRYTSGLKPKMRVTYEGRTFEIVSIVERGRRDEHELLVNEVTD